MRYGYISLLLISFVLVVLIAAAAATLVAERTRVCLHAAVANAAAAAFDWDTWQRSGVYQFANVNAGDQAGRTTFAQCADSLGLRPWVTGFWVMYDNVSPYHPAPSDRVWGVAAGPVPPPWIGACATLDYHFPLFRPGRTCEIIAVFPGVLE